MAGRYGFPSFSEQDKLVILRSKYTTITFEHNSRKMSYNGLLVWLNEPFAQTKEGHWSVASVDVNKVIDPLLRSDNVLADAGFKTIVLDPGHGGDDVGAIGERRTYEKILALDISKRVRKKLVSKGLIVRMTRENDVNLSLTARSALARQWNADLFVSIHCNAAHDTRANGVETYVMPPAGFSSTSGNMNTSSFPGNRHDRTNMLLAYFVHKELLARTGAADRGIRRARFDVLREASCPAILVECGFVSNKAEEKKLLTKEYRDSIAAGIADAIVEYVNKAKEAAAMSSN